MHQVLRRLHRDIVGDTVFRIGPEIGCDRLGGGEARADVIADFARGDAQLQGAGAIDLNEEVGRIDLLLYMSIDDPRNGGVAAAQLLGNAQVLDPVVTDRAHIDLRSQSKIQNLRRHIGGLEVEYVLRKGRRSICRNSRT